MVAEWTAFDLCSKASAVILVSQIALSLFNSARVLGKTHFFGVALPALMPLIEWLIAVYIVFYQTEWGPRHLGLAMVLLCPSFSLINSKLIVCNFTKMETQNDVKELLWFALFSINAKCKFAFVFSCANHCYF